MAALEEYDTADRAAIRAAEENMLQSESIDGGAVPYSIINKCFQVFSPGKPYL